VMEFGSGAAIFKDDLSTNTTPTKPDADSS
jgi:hypothetical protein